MLSININYDSQDTSKGSNGQLKDVAGVNGSPISVMPGFPDLEDQFNQMGITHIRLHDIYGVGDLDNGLIPGIGSNNDQMIPNVPANEVSRARNFIANFANVRTIYPNAAIGMSQGNYDLAFSNSNYEITDDYIRRIMNNNASVNPQGINREVLFRIGRTIDGGPDLPANFDIYVTLVATLVQRYSAQLNMSGIPRKVAYWEIWNEPDLPFFWNSSDPSRYYDFYSKIAWKIKEIDPSAKVGGAGVAAGYNPGSAYLDGLLSFCRQNNVPLDFLSWHYYANTTSDPQNIIDIGNSIQNTLQRYGFGNAESLCTEWNSTPQASVNVFTKVQSARNASYIASSLIYMQSCKVDRAYYYRGDALTFGLFNDEPNPVDPNFKSFCTYAAQAFAMFNQLKQTPNFMLTTDTSTSGISILAGKAGNIVKILVSNHRVDRSLSQPNVPPPNGRLYRQHYVDSGREVAQMTDDWSVQHYFGGKNPATLQNNDVVNRQPLAQQIPNNAELTPRSRNYSQSSGGVTLSISNLTQNIVSIETRRLTEGADLSGILPPIVQNVSFIMNGTTGIITDPGAVEYSVTLYTLTLGNGPVNPNNPNIPSPPFNPGGNAPIGASYTIRGDFSAEGPSVIRIATSMIPIGITVGSGSVWTLEIEYFDAIITGFSGASPGSPYTATLLSWAGPGSSRIVLSLTFNRSGPLRAMLNQFSAGVIISTQRTRPFLYNVAQTLTRQS